MSDLARRTLLALALVLVLVPAGTAVSPARAQDYEQTHLGPGLYAYQTRVRSATCGDATRTGFVSTYMGTIDGVPGDTEMQMKLINNRYWRDWSITVRRNGVVIGESSVPDEHREARFEVRREGGRYVGRGSRTYFSTVDGHRQRCTVTVDVLLRRFDV